MKITKQQALNQIEELKKYIEEYDNEEWVKIDYSVIKKELFDKYGVKPFKIMKRKMRDENDEVWNSINYFDAQKEAKKRGYRLPNVREMLLLMEAYEEEKQKVSYKDKEFLGIEELSYNEDVYLEWIEGLNSIAFTRGGTWDDTSNGGVFSLSLSYLLTNTYLSIGFRCAQ